MLVLGALLAACDGDGELPSDTAPPRAAILSPANGDVVFTANATVTGTASDRSGVAGVAVNGVVATSTDGFATWTVLVPVVLGANTLTVAAIDGAGNFNANVASIAVTRQIDVAAPTVARHFPPAHALTTGATVTVTGTAADAAGVAAVTVNGVAATTTDGFATWRATVPLAMGANPIVVEAFDGAGNFALPATGLTVSRIGRFLQRPVGMSYDAATERLIFLDNAQDAVLSMSPDDGTTTLISAAGRGTGAMPTAPTILDTQGTQAYAAQATDDTVHAIDLATGDRTLLAGAGAGTGPVLVDISDLGVDAARDRVLVMDLFDQSVPLETRLVAIDPVTGERSVVSGDGVGAGPLFEGRVPAVEHDAFIDRYVALAGGLVLIDPASGNRQDVPDGGGAPLDDGQDFVLIAADEAVVLRGLATGLVLGESLVHVNLVNGVRTALTLPAGPDATVLYNANNLERDPVSGELFVSERETGRVHGVTLATPTSVDAVREIEPAGTRIGAGVRLRVPRGLAYDADQGVVYTGDRRLNAVVRIDLDDGTRSVVSDATIGTGLNFQTLRYVRFDALRDRVLAIDFAGNLHAVDPVSGNRAFLRVLSGGMASGAVDIAADRLSYVDSSSVLRSLSLATLNSGLDVDLDPTGGVSPGAMTAFAHDLPGGRYVMGDSRGRMFAVDATGINARLVTDGATQDPPVTTVDAIVATRPGEAYLVDATAAEVFRLDLSSGALTRVHTPATATTPGTGFDVDLAWDAQRRVIYWFDNATHALTAFEPVSGDRVILSR